MTAARKYPPPVAASSHPTLPPRDFAVAREIIPTLCGRIVERIAQPEGRGHIYKLWEPVEDGRRYDRTRRGRDGRTWGLGHTLRPKTPLADADLVEHELAEQRRVMQVMRDRVLELGLSIGKPNEGRIRMSIFAARGDLLLLSDPEACAAEVRAARRGG